MAEGIPKSPADAESFNSDVEQELRKNKRKRRRKSTGSLGAIVSSEQQTSKAEEKTKSSREPKPIKGLFELADDKPDPAANTEEASAETEAATTSPEEQYETVVSRELAADEFSGGEVIINLRSGTVAHAEAATAEADALDEQLEPAVNLSEAEPVTEDETEPEAHVSAQPISPTEYSVESTNVQDEAWVSPRQSVATPAAQLNSTGVGGGRNTPPQSSLQPEENSPPPEALYAYRERAVEPSTDVLPAAAPAPRAEHTPDNQEVADAKYYGRRKGQSEGFWTGALLAGGYEHFKHRRRERRMKKELNRERESHEKSLEDMRWDAIRKEQAEKWRAAEAAKFTRAEQTAAIPKTEQKSERGKLEEQSQEDAELLQVPDGHRIERSAWHSVEVDERGHTVEDSAINYGHEFYKERAKEATPVDKSQLSNVTGGVALTAAAMHDIDEDDDSEAARLSRQNRDLAEHGKNASTATGSKLSKAAQSLSPSADSPTSLLPWIAVLVLLGLLLWWVS